MNWTPEKLPFTLEHDQPRRPAQVNFTSSSSTFLHGTSSLHCKLIAVSVLEVPLILLNLTSPICICEGCRRVQILGQSLTTMLKMFRFQCFLTNFSCLFGAAMARTIQLIYYDRIRYIDHGYVLECDIKSSNRLQARRSWPRLDSDSVRRVLHRTILYEQTNHVSLISVLT